MLQLYRRLLALRRSQAALHEGSWVPLGVQGNVLLYARGDGAQRMVVLLNFGATFASVDMGAQSRIPLPLRYRCGSRPRSTAMSPSPQRSRCGPKKD